MFTRKFWKLLNSFSFFAIAFCLQQAKADLIFDNGLPDSRNGSEMTHWFESDDFSLSETTRLESIKFWDFEIEGFFAGSVVWQIYTADSTGGPARLLYSGTSARLTHFPTGNAVSGAFKEYVSTFDILPITLPPGTYCLALHNGPLSNNTSRNFFWEASKSAAGAASYAKESPFNGPWRSNAFPGLPPDLAYQLIGAPLPQITDFTADGTTAAISFTSQPGRTYRVEYKDALNDPSWTLLPGADSVPGNGEVLRITDASGSRRQRFYRVGFSYSAAAKPTLTSFGLSNSGPRISFLAAAGSSYRVEYKNDITDETWSPVVGADFITGAGENVEVVDTEAPVGDQAHRVYRVTLY